MELENLKYVWRQMGDKPVREQSDEQIRVLMLKRPRDPIAKMRRNLTVEILVVGITYIPMIGYYLSGFNGKLSEIAWLLLIVLMLFAGYSYRKSRLLENMLCVTCQVRASLERQIGLLKRYTRFYRVAGTLLMPVLAIFTFLIIYLRFPSSPARNFSGMSLAISAILLGAFTIASWYFNGWYVNKLYGQHIKKLEDLLREMNEE